MLRGEGYDSAGGLSTSSLDCTTPGSASSALGAPISLAGISSTISGYANGDDATLDGVNVIALGHLFAGQESSASATSDRQSPSTPGTAG